MRPLMKRLNKTGETRQPCLTPEVTARSTATNHTCASSINTNIAPKIAWAPILLLHGGRAWSILSKALTAKETSTQFYISPVALCTSSCKLTCHIAAQTCPRTAKSRLVLNDSNDGELADNSNLCKYRTSFTMQQSVNIYLDSWVHCPQIYI